MASRAMGFFTPRCCSASLFFSRIGLMASIFSFPGVAGSWMTYPTVGTECWMGLAITEGPVNSLGITHDLDLEPPWVAEGRRFFPRISVPKGTSGRPPGEGPSLSGSAVCSSCTV